MLLAAFFLFANFLKKDKNKKKFAFEIQISEYKVFLYIKFFLAKSNSLKFFIDINEYNDKQAKLTVFFKIYITFI